MGGDQLPKNQIKHYRYTIFEVQARQETITRKNIFYQPYQNGGLKVICIPPPSLNVLFAIAQLNYSRQWDSTRTYSWVQDSISALFKNSLLSNNNQIKLFNLPITIISIWATAFYIFVLILLSLINHHAPLFNINSKHMSM